MFFCIFLSKSFYDLGLVVILLSNCMILTFVSVDWTFGYIHELNIRITFAVIHFDLLTLAMTMHVHESSFGLPLSEIDFVFRVNRLD